MTDDNSSAGITQLVSTILFCMEHVMGGGCCHVSQGLNSGVCVCVCSLLQEKQLNRFSLLEISDVITGT